MEFDNETFKHPIDAFTRKGDHIDLTLGPLTKRLF
jgi:hypothetical protein